MRGIVMLRSVRNRLNHVKRRNGGWERDCTPNGGSPRTRGQRRAEAGCGLAASPHPRADQYPGAFDCGFFFVVVVDVVVVKFVVVFGFVALAPAALSA